MSIREYHFAALVYDSEHGQVRCALCGRAMEDDAPMARVNGRWACIRCVEDGALPYSEPMLAGTLGEIAKN